MSEELLKAIIKLFAIVSKERITDDERANIKEFLALQFNQEAIKYYLNLFDEFCKANRRNELVEISDVDAHTLEFVDDWAQIMQICKQVNQALTMQQKVFLIAKIIELVFNDGEISERQGNLIFYIGEALKIPIKDIQNIRAFVLGQDIDELASKSIMIIDEGGDTHPHPGPRIVTKNLTGLIAILRLHDIETYFIKYLGISTLYLNSVALKSRKINVFPTGSTIKGSKIEPIYYSDVVGKFLIGESDTELSFVADHIFYHFKSGRAGLQNVSIAEKGGKLIGFMGASGSGKSTLLNVLNGSERPSSGRVIINGINIHEHPEKVEGIIGFIPQDDLLIEDLTVFENLYYASRLCFGHYTREQNATLVEKVLVNLGLAEIRNLKVGSPLQKTISGGQRKRVNIGLELLREPAVLFVDEPTSGLSSSDSENIMDLLKELALRGKMIFVVIHQPSSDIFKMFDTLIILDVGGFQIYYGNPVESVSYFQEIINKANKIPGACPECGNINSEQIFNIIETRVVNEFGRFTHTRKISPGQWYQYFKQRIKVPKVEEVDTPLPIAQKIPHWFKQLTIFSIRDVLAKLANQQYMLINLLLSPILALFMAYFIKYYDTIGIDNPKYTFFYNYNVPVYFFMSIVVALFVGLIVSAEEIFRDRKILKREKYLHLSKSSYLVSKVIVLFALSAVQTLSFIVVGDLIMEIPLSEMRYWLVLFSCSCFANMLGLNISSAFDSAVTIYILIPILIIPQLILSGVVINFDKFNPKVGTPKGIPLLGEMMASRWAYEAFMVTQFKDNPFERQFYELDKKQAMAEYKKVYYIPTLESKVTYCLNNRSHWRNSSEPKLTNALAVLKNEISHELALMGGNGFTQVEKLEPGKVDSATLINAAKYLRVLKELYSVRMAKAIDEKEDLIEKLTDTPEKEAAFQRMRLAYQNDAVIQMVEHTNDPIRIVEWDGELVQKIYPIYFVEHRPANQFDFRANFFIPQKYFLGSLIDTFYFNLGVIWCMILFLYGLLYFEGLQKLVHGFNMRRKYRKRN